VVGTFCGSLVGSVIGTLVGRLFDPHIVTHAGWTAGLADSHETIHDANGNVVQELTFNADASVTTDTGT
jgi:hypothetical protein